MEGGAVDYPHPLYFFTGKSENNTGGGAFMVQGSEKRSGKGVEQSFDELEKRGVFSRTSPPGAPGEIARKRPKFLTRNQKTLRKRRGKRARERGQETECFVERKLLESGATGVEKSREYYKGKVWDVRAELGGHSLWVQVKTKKKWDMMAKFIRRFKKTKLNVLFHHVDFHGNVVTMRWSDFIKLCKGQKVGDEKESLPDEG
jgi:hypothetical protein